MKLSLSLGICLLLSACSVFHKPAVQAPISNADHSRYQMLNVHSTLLLVKPRYDAKTLTPDVTNLYNQTAQAFNVTSRLYEDYLQALRVHGDSKWVLKRFQESLVRSSDLGGVLKLQFNALPVPVDSNVAVTTEAKKP